MQSLENMFRVLIVGLVLGAGLPALFAVGLRVYSSGAGGVDEDGVLRQPHPILKPVGLLIFLVVAVVIVAAVLWVTRSTIIHHFGVDLFPFVPKKN
jgi:hypothetical protein